jgi:hypothetical protein
MPRIETMPLDEKFKILMKSHNLEQQGKPEETERVRKQVPLQPYLAKFLKDHLGLDALLQSGWNLSEAEAEFGPGWLVQ